MSKKWNATGPGDEIRQPELWSGNSDFLLKNAAGGGVKFAPYYTIKNPARTLNETGTEVSRTVDLCYDANDNRIGGSDGFCSILPATHPGPDWWKSASSPFTGSVRAVNFKGLALSHAGGAPTFCTTPTGEYADSIPYAAGEILQKAAPITNHWQQQASGQCVLDTSQVCHGVNLEGTIERWTLGYQNGQWIATNIGPLHLGGSKYRGARIGFEWIINNGNDAGVRPPN